MRLKSTLFGLSLISLLVLLSSGKTYAQETRKWGLDRWAERIVSEIPDKSPEEFVTKKEVGKDGKIVLKSVKKSQDLRWGPDRFGELLLAKIEAKKAKKNAVNKTVLSSGKIVVSGPKFDPYDRENISQEEMTGEKFHYRDIQQEGEAPTMLSNAVRMNEFKKEELSPHLQEIVMLVELYQKGRLNQGEFDRLMKLVLAK